MNIGLFTDTYYPQINGVVTSTCMLKAQLEKLGHRVYVFTTTDPRANEKLPRVFRLPSLPFLFLPSHRMAYMYSPKLLMSMKKLKLDIVHTQTEFPVGMLGKVVAELYRLPLVHTYHTMYEDYVHYVANGHLITPKMAQSFSRVFCNRARVVIAPVEKTKRSLLEYGVRRPIEIIPTGLDLGAFRRDRYSAEDIAEVRREAGLAPEDPVVVYVGRVAKEKSLEAIIFAMQKLLLAMPRAKLVIVGDGPLRETFQALAVKLGVGQSVVFMGAKPWAVIGKYYQMGDVFATASTSETQGLTYLEAMAAQVPVAAKKDQSVEGIITHGETGWLFDDDDDLPGLLRHALENREEARRVARRGCESIAHLSAERFAQNVEALYLRMLEEDGAQKKEKRNPLKLWRAKRPENPS